MCYANSTIMAKYCPFCNHILINRERCNFFAWKKSIRKMFHVSQREETGDENDENWFDVYRRYVDSNFKTVVEFRDYMTQMNLIREEERIRKKRELAKEQERREDEAIKLEMQKALIKRNGEPLGSLPKQRKRGFFS